MTKRESSRSASLPGVARFRLWAERAFAPRVRADVLAIQAHLQSLRQDHDELVRQVARLGDLSEQLARAQGDLAARMDESFLEIEASLARLSSTTDELRETAGSLQSRLALVGDSVATSNSLARRVQREIDRLTSAAPHATERHDPDSRNESR